MLFCAVSHANTKGSLFLEGRIPLLFDIRIQPEKNNIGNIDLRNGETDLKVAEVLEASNIVSGYTVSIESVNAGVLLHNNGTSSTPYTLQYAATGTPISPPPVGSPAVVKSSGPLVGLTLTVEELFFSTAPNNSLIGGAYTDTIILSIQAL